MLALTQTVHDLVQGIDPLDTLEAQHRTDTLRWLESTDDIFRRRKPATPDRHLVSYVAVVDPRFDITLLGEHLNAGLWLPPGGHVEPGEHPTSAAEREAREELAIEPVFHHGVDRPRFITVTRTVGIDHGHIDVSLWYLLTGNRNMPLTTDPSEFSCTRWWSRDEVWEAGATVLDPHYKRFVKKVSR